MLRTLSILSCAVLSSSALAVLSTFDTDAEGWTTVNVVFNNPNAPTTVSDEHAADWTGTDGKPAGSLLRANDGAVSNDWRFFSAPTTYLGDQSLAFETDFTYDTKSDLADGKPYPAVILRSGTTFLYHVALPPASDWTSVTVPFIGSAWSTVPEGTDAVDDATLKSILGRLDGLYIDADWYSLPTETSGLDNVHLRTNPVPEPMTIATLGVGSIVALRRRRKA